MGEKRSLVDSFGCRWSRGCAENQGRETPRNPMTQEALEADQDVEGWLRPEFEWALAGDGSENIAG